MKQFIQAYFNFTKKERRGILTLCSFIIVISFFYIKKARRTDVRRDLLKPFATAYSS